MRFSTFRRESSHRAHSIPCARVRARRLMNAKSMPPRCNAVSGSRISAMSPGRKSRRSRSCTKTTLTWGLARGPRRTRRCRRAELLSRLEYAVLGTRKTDAARSHCRRGATRANRNNGRFMFGNHCENVDRQAIRVRVSASYGINAIFKERCSEEDVSG